MSSRSSVPSVSFMNSRSRSVFASPSSYSTPAYRSSWFSRTTTRSVSGNRVRTPSYALHGRRHANRSSSLRSATFIERNPEPTGVVIGPLIASPRSLIESITRSGSGVPSSS